MAVKILLSTNFPCRAAAPPEPPRAEALRD
jgi:hypothetical protein